MKDLTINQPNENNQELGKETLRVCAKIDLDAVRYNMESMHRNLREGTKMVAVIKADAYGHGAVGISGVLEELPYVWGYAVATAEEVFHLIAAGRKKPMMLLGLTFPQEYESLVEAGIRITICSLGEAQQLSAVAKHLGKTAYVHIALDTGMGRIGFPTYGGVEDAVLSGCDTACDVETEYGSQLNPAAESTTGIMNTTSYENIESELHIEFDSSANFGASAKSDSSESSDVYENAVTNAPSANCANAEDISYTIEMITAISALDGIEVEGVFTHFARADETDKSSAYQQLQRYRRVVDTLEAQGVHIPIRHCSNSAGILEISEANMDMVRAGITLYGLWPSDEVSRDIVPIRPVMSLESHITYIKVLPAGCAISYGGTYVTSQPTRIATVPVGYADGYARSLSNKGYVLIHGKRAPICGRVCMDQFMVDVTDIPEALAGDLVTLLGQNGEERITMEDLGELSGRFNYEFACLIAPRVPRVFMRVENI